MVKFHVWPEFDKGRPAGSQYTVHSLQTGATPVPKGENGQRKLEVGISIMDVWRMKIQSIMFGVELVLNFFSE